LGFVQLAYPWEEPGELAGFKGPDTWQRAFLADLGRQIRGHGIGRSTLVAWIVDWLMSTRQAALPGHHHRQHVHAARNQDLGRNPEVDSAVRDGPVVSVERKQDVSPGTSADLVLLGTILLRREFGGNWPEAASILLQPAPSQERNTDKLGS